MKVTVLGTGMVGRAIALGLAGLGHDVVVGTRDAAASLARTETDDFGTWASMHSEIEVAPYAEASRGAELVVNALNGQAAIAGLEAARIADGTVLLDISNPLDFSGDHLRLFMGNDDSLGELIQREFETLRVVKSLNTMTADVMVDPSRIADGDFTTFVSGNDDAAKAQVISLLTALGHRDVIDLGDISTARGTEALMLIWVRLMGPIGTPYFSFKIAR
ncbi:NADPH-dependent F420 reductase [Nocardioides piscis]|uniref:NAD(P)-binding domain-containing protein n=1 Tax=Nocardioides piscis TaxID=2714938 RepID=A0A6G7YEA2_9ACTN|nr:NAD(P)-binding domain-containing protein [Nocardioides piscis]QIK74968.1 NAD(P)-binding domain-containing protein [Nocardioides piscis]